jgi:hypothetical protein
VVNTERECAWEGAAAVDWIALTSSQTGRGPGQLDFRVLANPDSLARQGAITVSDQRLEINQGAAPCRVTVGTSAFTLGADGGNEAVPVTAPRGCSWTVTSAANWISVPVDTGSGSARLAFTVQANAGAPRSGRLTVGDQTITIAQSTGVPSCSYAISPMTQAIAATGGPGAVAVTAGSGCAWSATSNAPWISVQAASSWNRNVTFAVTPKRWPARSGTASVAGQLVYVQSGERTAAAAALVTISPGSSIGGERRRGHDRRHRAAGCSGPWRARLDCGHHRSDCGAGSAGVTVSFPRTGAARSGIVSIAGRRSRIKGCCLYLNQPNK